MPINATQCQSYLVHMEDYITILNIAPDTRREAFKRIESELTLDELKTILNELKAAFDANPTQPTTAFELKLKTILANRWQRIQGSFCDYTHAPLDPANQLCLQLAHDLSPLPPNREGLEKLKREGPYFLLMPTLTAYQTAYEDNIHNFELHKCILSDDATRLIPIYECLRRAFLSDEGSLKHIMSTSQDYPILSKRELERLRGHSRGVSQFCTDLEAYNDKRLNQVDLGSKLAKLVIALKKGGITTKGDAYEFNAGDEANIGILEFYEFWKTLSESEQTHFYRRHPSLISIIGRLFRPESAEYARARYCVETLANDIVPIVKQLQKENGTLKNFKAILKAITLRCLNGVDIAKMDELHEMDELVQMDELHKIDELYKMDQLHQYNTTGRFPKILRYVFSKMYSYPDSFIDYLLLEVPYALPEYAEVIASNNDEKNRIAYKQVLPDGTTALMIAARDGCLESTQILLQWGSLINAATEQGHTALHFAAMNGHLDIVRYLIAQGCDCTLKSQLEKTALCEAIDNDHSDVVDELLLHTDFVDSKILSLGNNSRIPHSHYLSLLDKVLAKATFLPLEQQQLIIEQHSILMNENDSDEQSILEYIARKRADRLNPIMNILRGETTEVQSRISSPLLHRAIDLRSTEFCRVLLTLNANPDLLDSNCESALYKAIRSGNLSILSLLLNHGANTEERYSSGATAIHWAIQMRGTHPQMLAELLRRNISIQTRIRGSSKNAIDIAIEELDYSLLETLLCKAILLSPDEQTELLRRVDGGIFNNVLSYAHTKQLPFLSKLIDLSGQASFRAASEELNSLFEVDYYVQQFIQMTTRMRQNRRYLDALPVAENMIRKILFAKNQFILSNDNSLSKLGMFKAQCLEAVNAASPMLNRHREWGKLILKFLLILMTFPISIPLYAAGFFSFKTKSAQQLNRFKHDLEEIRLVQP
jgi:ankyrin repeat protein